MDPSASYLSPALPGAWSSTWTLSPDPDSQAQRTPMPPKDIYHHISQSDLGANPAQMEPPCLNDPEHIDIQQHSTPTDTDSIHSGDDTDSLPASDDFYSFVSHQDTDTDTDTTLFPSVMSISSAKGTRNPDRVPDSLDFSVSTFDCLDSNSSVHISNPEGKVLSDEVYFGVDVTSTSAHQVVSSGRDSAQSLNTPNEYQASISSNNFWSEGISDNVSLAPTDERSDSQSTRSNYSKNEANLRDPISRLDAGNMSQGSIDSWSRSSSRNDNARHARRRGIEIEVSRREEDHQSILHFSQPSGDNPWTLSLDPTLTSAESVSQSSAVSIDISLESASVLNDDNASIISHRNILASMPSFESPSSRAVDSHSHEDDEIRTTRQDSSVSIYGGEPLDPSFASHNTPTPLPFVVYSQNEPVRPKGVIQKTKDLCSKFKKFVTSKAARQKNPKQNNDTPSIPHGRTGLDLLDFEISPPLPQGSSPVAFSVHGYPGYQRVPKLSTTSVPLGFHAGHNNLASSGVVNTDERYTLEYHARPKTLKEIKSKRRISLPTFSGGSARHLSPFSTTKRRQAGSILSAQEIGSTP